MDKAPGFLQTFIGSFVNFKNYPQYAQRSGLSMAGHYLLVVTLCCSMYALVTSHWLNSNLSPYLDDLAANVPAITVENGKAKVDIEQPHFFEIEGQKVAVIDTTQDPQVYLDEYEQIVILSESKFISKEASGKIESYDLTQDFSVDSKRVSAWVETLESWFFAGMFLICFFWAIFLKATQGLVASAVVTLVQQSRPNFSTHWKLANLALGPAMVFGVVVYSVSLHSLSGLPGTGALFWLILGGLTYFASCKLRKSPSHS